MGMSKAEEEEQARLERARAAGLFRYMLIREAADPALSSRQRGKMVREIAAREHADPSGRPVRVTRWTLDVWIRRWRQGGFDALVPSPRQSQPRTPPEVMELAAALKKENPARSPAQVQRILKAQAGRAPDETTIRRMFTRTGLTALTPAADAPASGRFEAARPNEIWTGDALHAIRVQGRKTYLFAFTDDHSRAVMAARFGFAEDTIRLAAALRPALGSRGIPEHAYVGNGSAFVDARLLRACAKLGIKLVRSQPGRPEGRGKIERFFRTVRDQFLVELTEERAARIPDLAELNKLFTAWTEAEFTTSGSIRRPGSRRWPGGKPAARSRSPPTRTWLRRSAGPNGGPCPGRRWSRCTETGTRSTRRWPAGAWSWSSTHSTWMSCSYGTTGRMPGPRPRIRSPATPTPRPARKTPAAATTRPAPPAWTTSPCSASSTTGKESARSTTTPSCPPAAATAARPPPGRTARNRTGGEQAARTAVDHFRQVVDLDQAASDDTVRLARTAAEAIRGLNWLTRHETGLGQPSTAYDTIGALTQAASRPGQLLTQITGWLDQALAAGRLGHDLGEDPAPAIDAAAVFPGDARMSAAALAGDLDAAQQQLALINGRPRTRKEQS